MSLINEALKKAQSEQHGKHAPSARTPGIRPVADGGNSKRPLVLAGVGLAVVLGAVAVWHFVLDTPEEPLPAPVRRVAPAPAVVKPAPVVVTPPPAVVAPVPEVVSPKPVVVKPAPVVPKSNPAVAALVEVMRVTLAKASTGRCVVDGVILRVNERVCEEPRITLLKVSDDAVIFTDANGVEYAKEVSH